MTEQVRRSLNAARKILARCDSRDPAKIARELGICVLPRHFARQLGVYKVIERNRYIFIKEDLPPALFGAVLLHEIGHDTLHRSASLSAGGFGEYSLFENMQEKAMEWEANLFAAELALPDEALLEMAGEGKDACTIAAALHTEPNLVALKVYLLNEQGYSLRVPGYDSRFLRK